MDFAGVTKLRILEMADYSRLSGYVLYIITSLGVLFCFFYEGGREISAYRDRGNVTIEARRYTFSYENRGKATNQGRQGTQL